MTIKVRLILLTSHDGTFKFSYSWSSKIGNAVLMYSEALNRKTLAIHYYESFAKTHQGHGTDLAIVGGAMGYSNVR